MEEKIQWITSVDQVTTANEASLRRSLTTLDGSGVAVKQAALEELLRRAVAGSQTSEPIKLLTPP